VDGADYEAVEESAMAANDCNASIVVACSADEDYPEGVPVLTARVKQHNARCLVVVAGKPGEHEAVFRAAGVDAFVNMESDAGAVLAEILGLLGVRLPDEER
jgi:methylmalonyl-CoA mutase